MSTISGLVNRRVAQTRAEIVEAALRLFVDQGFDATSMSQIADAAGMSRRTIYRYFETKDDLVFESPRQWLGVLNRVLDTRRDDESTRDVTHRALLEVARFIDDDSETALAGFSVLTGSPSLRERHGRSDAEWVARYVALIAPDVTDQPDVALLVTTAAMTLVAAQNALIAVWATDQPNADLIRMTKSVLGQVDSIWPAASR